jgi:hypothetical protein
MFARVLTPRATGLPALDAQADFRLARRLYLAAQARRWVTRQRDRGRPNTLSEASSMVGGPPQLTVVPLNQIVGTVEPTSHFDTCLRPASELVRPRWERIALAHRRGIPLPPIELARAPDGYYILDGRHRVSVARTLRHTDIDAWVYRPTDTPAAPHRAANTSDGPEADWRCLA